MHLRHLTFVLVLIGCQDNPPAIYPTVAPFDETRLTLGPGDRIELVIFYGAHDNKATYTLDPTGHMEVQYIGTVNAKDKTVAEVQAEIAGRLLDGYLIDPVVSL